MKRNGDLGASILEWVGSHCWFTFNRGRVVVGGGVGTVTVCRMAPERIQFVRIRCKRRLIGRAAVHVYRMQDPPPSASDWLALDILTLTHYCFSPVTQRPQTRRGAKATPTSGQEVDSVIRHLCSRATLTSPNTCCYEPIRSRGRRVMTCSILRKRNVLTKYADFTIEWRVMKIKGEI